MDRTKQAAVETGRAASWRRETRRGCLGWNLSIENWCLRLKMASFCLSQREYGDANHYCIFKFENEAGQKKRFFGGSDQSPWMTTTGTKLLVSWSLILLEAQDALGTPRPAPAPGTRDGRGALY